MESNPPGADLSSIALALNPNGDPPNFADSPSLLPAVTGVGVTMIITSGILVILRLFTNIKHTGKMALDDCMFVLNRLPQLPAKDRIHNLGRDGAIKHTWDVPLSIMTPSFIKRTFTQQMIIGPSIWAAKAAILALYIRAFGTVRWLRFTSYGLMAFMFLFYWTNSAIAAAYCTPRNGGPWDATVFARCMVSANWSIVLGVLDVTTDLVMYFLPFPIINRLQLARRKLIGLRVVFLVGFIAVVASAASLAYKVYVFSGNDPIWNGINLAITTVVEVHITIIVSCAPALSSFWLNIFTKSRLYYSLRSSILCRTPLSKERKHVDVAYNEKAVHNNYDSSPDLNHLIHDELSDGVSGHSRAPHTEMYSSTGTSIPMSDYITQVYSNPPVIRKGPNGPI
ncbi:MAG: hypothetical protein Q9181_002577 [Wetmoreana brouardii]